MITTGERVIKAIIKTIEVNPADQRGPRESITVLFLFYIRSKA